MSGGVRSWYASLRPGAIPGRKKLRSAEPRRGINGGSGATKFGNSFEACRTTFWVVTNPVCMFLMYEQVFIYSRGEVMLSQPQRRSIWGWVSAPHPRPFTPFSVTPEKLAHGVN